MKFVVCAGLVAAPPVAPPFARSLGVPCFRATVDLIDAARGGATAGRFTGYGCGPGVCRETETACRRRLESLDGDYQCGASVLALLRTIPGLKCEGVYFELGTTRSRVA